MRIVGGRWRGRPVEAPVGRGVTRPTTERVRESLASMILSARGLSLEGVSVLDAFAGSGAMGLELVSRGAAHVTLIERDRAAAACARRNAARLGAGADEVTVVVGDAFRLATRPLTGAPFSVVVLDPPYATGADKVAALVADLAASAQLADGAHVIYERDASAPGIDAANVAGIATLRSKRHGTTACDLLEIRLEEA